MGMSFRPTDLLAEVSPRLPALPESEAHDDRSSFGDYWVTRDLLRAVMMLADVEALDAKGSAFRVKDSYDSLLQVSPSIHRAFFFFTSIIIITHLLLFFFCSSSTMWTTLSA